MTGWGRTIRTGLFLTRLVLATVTFSLVGVTIFFVAFVVVVIVVPSISWDAANAIAAVSGLAGGGLAAFGVWRLSRRRSNYSERAGA